MTEGLIMQPEDVLYKYWGHTQFRSIQKDIITQVIQGQDTLAILPTGAGKSVCFQVPTLLKKGMCIVVTPLIALMKDQVEQLKNKQIKALSLHSGMDHYEIKQTLNNALYGDYKFLYISPERVQTELFQDYLEDLTINLIAIDEAHCISQWGYDFRPAYLALITLRELLPKTPIIAVTATATPHVQKDITTKLALRNPKLFVGKFEKPNLALSILKCESKQHDIINLIKQLSGSGLVYCRTRKDTEKVADLLKMHAFNSAYYHAGLTQDDRSSVQKSWMDNEKAIIVCTNAFGMGIDKADVRWVIHYSPPDCLENYYQEVGRAGRDGQPCRGILLFDEADEETLNEIVSIKYPSIQKIQEIYLAMSNYLNIPVGVGEGLYYDFDFSAFTRIFKKDPRVTISVLKILEQEGHIQFHENSFRRSQILIKASRDEIIDLQHKNEKLAELITVLSRMYEGIYDYKTSISEEQIAIVYKQSVDTVLQLLQLLHNNNLISYHPHEDKPQILFLLNRAPSRYISFNLRNYEMRKQQYAYRVLQLKNYLYSQVACRSSILVNYFTNQRTVACGICDNCIDKNRDKSLNKQIFNQIQTALMDFLEEAPLPIEDIFTKLDAYSKNDIIETARFLIKEQRLQADQNNVLQIRHP
ncbi:MAG: ATP-dependent DNA helicase RecQ [Phycisphaerales bacterium]|nr:ATP-dependent DNA helicase RecQ [Phycisphaerales bacterium]